MKKFDKKKDWKKFMEKKEKPEPKKKDLFQEFWNSYTKGVFKKNDKER